MTAAPATDPSTVSAAGLLSAVEEFIARYVVLPGADGAAAAVLFVLHTWALEAAYATPYLIVVSPERRTGKSRLLEVLRLLVRSPWHTVSTSEAALFRKIDQDRPTLLLDELDATFASNSERTEPLRAILNAGNRRGATATRAVGQGANMQARDFDVFCPKVLAGIDTGRLPDTIRDRAIVLHMKRRHDGEPVERFRERFAQQDAAAIVETLECWGNEWRERLGAAEPALPDALNDRAADAWEPLLAIADHAGGEWPERARGAALALCGDADAEETSRGTLLLAAIRAAINGRELIATTELLDLVNADEELPFGAWRDGKGLDGRTLANLLGRYRVRPTTLRIGDRTPKGYRASELADVFARYLPSKEPQQGQHAQHDALGPPATPRREATVVDVADVADAAHSGDGEGMLLPSDADEELARIRAKFSQDAAA